MKLSYVLYTEDIIENVLWRWDYAGQEFDITSLSAFCPECKIRLIYDNRSVKSYYRCDRCDNTLFEFQGNRQGIYSHIFREIERRINTGEWLQKVKTDHITG